MSHHLPALNQKDIDRFWSRVKIGEPDECWPWLGTPSGNGYGRIGFGKKMFTAHCVAYELLVGQIPEGLTLDHTCRNRICCNPKHLEPVTEKVNILRGTSPSAENARKTHCPRGHPYNESNTYVHKDGRRDCIICVRENVRKWRAEHREHYNEQAREYKKRGVT